MKRTHKRLTRLLSAGMSLALLTTLLPGALAAPSGSLSRGYTMDSDEELVIEYSDFDDYCGNTIDRIRFTYLPDSDEGTLYYYYSDDEDDYEEVDEGSYIYYEDFYGVLFVPEEDFDGTIEIDFEGRDEDRDSFDGTIEIDVNGIGTSSSSGDVTYETDVNDEVYLDVDDFDDYVYDSTRSGDEVDYIYFTSLPSSSKGTLYYDGTRSSDEVGKNDDFDHDEIDDLLFIPDDDYEGSVTIPFKGEADSGESISGDLVINVGIGGDAEVVVKLNASTGNPITFDADDFNDAVMDETGYNLNYVVFDYASGRGGYLYFDYDGASEDEVDDARYYRSSSPSLNDVTFVPGSAAGSTTRIPFKAYTTNNKTVNGEVEITYVTLSSPSVVSYTSNGLAVTFRSSDFAAACAARGGSSLVSVTFPSASVTGGQLYYGFETPTNYQRGILSTVSYSYGSSGLYRLDEVTFLPKAEYTGSVVIPYVGTDADGITYNGNIQITVTPPSSTTRFNDMGNYSWAVPGVEFLAAYGITTGTGTGTTYSPASQLTRGDYILMLVRTFNLTASSTGNFSDVKADAYYADALAVAKALGIATADANGNFRPTEGVTRQDAMVFLYRAMQKANRTVPNAYDSYLTRFPDGASVATDARPAMAAMAQAGVIKGDQAGRLNPTGTLTRAEMATILHRALTL